MLSIGTTTRKNQAWSLLFRLQSYLGCGEKNGNPLQQSCLENPMDGGAWWAADRGVARSQTRLSNFPFTFHFHALEKEMATHSSVLAWRIPGMGSWVGCHLWVRTELDTTEATQQQQHISVGMHNIKFYRRELQSPVDILLMTQYRVTISDLHDAFLITSIYQCCFKFPHPPEPCCPSNVLMQRTAFNMVIREGDF